MPSALALLLLAATGTAEPRVRLTFLLDAPGCPEQQALEAAVSARLGYSPFDEQATRRAEVSLQTEGAGLKGTLQLFVGERRIGRRVFSSSTRDCSELASSLELALAIAIDPQAMSTGPRPRGQVTATPKLEPPPPERVAAASPPPAPQPTPHLALGLSGAMVTGLSPTVTAGFGLEAALRWSALEVSVRGRADLQSVVPKLTTHSFSAALALCGVLRFAGLCAVGAGGVLQLAGPTTRASRGLGLAGGRLFGRFEVLEHLWVLPEVQVLAILTRVTALSGSEVVWVTAPLAFDAGLSLRYEFF